MLWHMYTYWCYRFVRYATKYQVTYENRKLPTYYAVWTGRQVCKYAWCGDNVATGTNEIVGTCCGDNVATGTNEIVGTPQLRYMQSTYSTYTNLGYLYRERTTRSIDQLGQK